MMFGTVHTFTFFTMTGTVAMVPDANPKHEVETAWIVVCKAKWVGKQRKESSVPTHGH